MFTVFLLPAIALVFLGALVLASVLTVVSKGLNSVVKTMDYAESKGVVKPAPIGFKRKQR